MSNNRPKVSVVVSVYNGEAYLRRCLDSLVVQTLKELEIIVVNDASTDGTGQIILEYAKRYPHLIRGIHLDENLRQGGARNVGFRQAAGEYLAYCDADDWVDPEMYEKLYCLAQSKNYDRSSCYYCKHHMDDNSVEYKNAPRGWSSLLRASLIQKHQLYFPEKTAYEDIFFIKLIGYYLPSTAILPEYLYHYRIHKNSTTHALTSDVMRQRIAVETAILDELERRGLEHSPFSVETNAEFLSRGILMLCHAWFTKVGEEPDAVCMTEVKQTVKTRLPEYRKALHCFCAADRFRLFLFLHAQRLFLPAARLMIKCNHKKPWGKIRLGFCAERG